ncbi:MAG TPA: glycosyltransferase family 39 protein [Terriglobales bacterium]|nr:glycosyltransferase family 39 protein [Terriglobales bacterium]
MSQSVPAVSVPSDSLSSTARARARIYVLAILVVWAAIYVSSLFQPALLDDADSVHAEAAREMVLRHDWVTLYIDGIRYLEKAPLLYWGMAASFKTFGVSEWSARLPLALGVLALLLATFRLGRRVFGAEGGLYSALALGACFGIYIYTRFQIPDVLVALWLTLGFDFFLQGLEESPPSRLACWGLAAATALDVLTKGLIGLVFPGAIILVYLLLSGNLRHLARMRLLSSTLVFLAVAAPWHVLAALRNPTQGHVRGFLWFYFVNEHFLRYLNERVPRDYGTVPLAVFWALLLLWLAPWSVFLPQAVRAVPLRLRAMRSQLTARDRANLLFLVWAAVIMLFFSFSTRQEYYNLPAVPAIALLVGGWMERESSSPAESRERRAGRISSLVLFVIGIAGFIAAMVMLQLSETAPPGAELADLLHQRAATSYVLSFGHIFDLTPQALGVFRGPLLGVALALLLGTGLNWYLRRRGSPARGNLALAAMSVALLLCVHSAFSTFAPILSSKKLALAIQQHYKAGDTIVIDGEYEQGSTLNFYTGIPVHILHERSANLWYGSQFPDAPQVFETEESFVKLWQGAGQVFLWAEGPHPPQVEGLRVYELAHSGGKYILTNRATP